MAFLKKTLTALGAFFLILWGGAGTQSNNMLLQGGGFIGLIIGLVVLYIFVKMAWRAMGCLPSLLIITGIFAFILYAIGGFSNGVTGIIPTMRAFLGQQPAAGVSQVPQGTFSLIDEDDIDTEAVEISEECAGECQEAVARAQAEFAQQKRMQAQNVPEQSAGTFSKLMGSFGGKSKPQASLNPADYPAVYGSVRVINGDTLMMNGHYIRLFGIDAPESDQTCANRSGRSYHCGRQAATWLRDWITDNELECRIMQQDARGNMVGVCSLGQYDLGAALVNAGWAVAYTKYTDIYMPYQDNAMKQRVGLWQGRFYMPWDWRAIKAKKPNIKVVKPKVKRNSMWNF